MVAFCRRYQFEYKRNGLFLDRNVLIALLRYTIASSTNADENSGARFSLFMAFLCSIWGKVRGAAVKYRPHVAEGRKANSSIEIFEKQACKPIENISQDSY